ncbi:MAG: hypothetical protein J7493_17070 [Porphyrobacter sp.]|nr:hypothetical protein [Porphyrobacter sp.]
MKRFAITFAALSLAATAHAQNIAPAAPAPAPTYAAVIAMDVPVVAGDITDRPYRVVGDITAEVRRATVFSKNASEAKVYRELWERAEKLGADAVVNASYGDARVVALSWGSRRATGQAIKFLTDAEIAARR